MDEGRAVHLRSADGELEATYLPDAGMRCSSLRHRGAELLAGEDAIPDPVLRSAMRGIPLLHPWANRLAADRYTAGGRTGELPEGAPFVPRDGGGLAIHGLIAAPGAWSVQTGAGAGTVRAEMTFPTDDARAAAFPFPHRIGLDAALDASALSVRVRLEPTAGVAVPVAFGFHPYLRPAGDRSGWRVELPARTRLVTDDAGLPSGGQEAAEAYAGALPDTTVDDPSVGLEPGAELAVTAGDRRIALRLETGFPVAHVYSPADADFICLEPMTAPPNALASGEGLRWVELGDAYEATFRLEISPA